ncbi:B12-binding domain-containing protein, partial [Methanohalophilus halophilus]
MGKQEMYDKLRDAIVNQDINGAGPLVQEALDAGLTPFEIINDGL